MKIHFVILSRHNRVVFSGAQKNKNPEDEKLREHLIFMRNPGYACIFTSLRTEVSEGYEEMAERMLSLAQAQEGFLGVESHRDPDGRGVTISYWTSLEAIQRWKAHPEHQVAQKLGWEQWYHHYQIRICRLETDKSWP